MSTMLHTAGELSSGTGAVLLGVSGMGGVAIQVVGSFSGTVAFEGASDGATFVPLSAADLGTGTAGTSTTSAGVFLAAVGGLSVVRVSFSAYSSGSAGITLQAVHASPGGAGGSGGGGGGAVTIADGADVTEGAIADTAVTGDNSGTVNAHLRGLTKILADVWNSVTHVLNVTFTNTTIAVTNAGTFAVQATLAAGSALIGKVSIDQTTPGTTNAVSATNLPTTVDTNSGNKSASTIRMVLATDQPQLTNKLLVTPDANSTVDVNKIAGTTTSVGNGASGNGVQRVTVANDSTGILASVTAVGGVGAACSVSASQLTASGDTNLLASGNYTIRRVEASNSSATTPLVVGLKTSGLNSGAVFGKKYLPAAGGQAVWVFPQGKLSISSATFVGNLSTTGQVEFTVYYE